MFISLKNLQSFKEVSWKHAGFHESPRSGCGVRARIGGDKPRFSMLALSGAYLRKAWFQRQIRVHQLAKTLPLTIAGWRLLASSTVQAQVLRSVPGASTIDQTANEISLTYEGGLSKGMTIHSSGCTVSGNLATDSKSANTSSPGTTESMGIGIGKLCSAMDSGGSTRWASALEGKS